ELQVTGQLRHEADVRKAGRHHHRVTTAPRGAHVHLGDRSKLTSAEGGAAGGARRTGGEDDGNRAVRVGLDRRRFTVVDAFGEADVHVGVDDEIGLEVLEHGGTFALGAAVADSTS